MLYNTCLKSPQDYEFLEAGEIVQYTRRNPYSRDFRYEHEARKWEYGLAMKLIKQYSPRTMLNVGGGNSPLSLWASERGVEVTEIDPNRPAQLFTGIKYIHEHFPIEGLGQYELVVCTSVIEHVPEDAPFYRALLSHAGDLVFITTDFHPSGQPIIYPAHLRTYNDAELSIMIEAARLKGFSPIGDVDYSYGSNMVNNYTFAALALVRSVG